MVSFTFLHGLAAGDDTQQNEYDCDDQQEMDEAADGIGAYQAEQPKNKKNDSDGIEHGSSFHIFMPSVRNGDAGTFPD